MDIKPMKLLIVEDDINDINAFKNCIKNRNDFELIRYYRLRY